MGMYDLFKTDGEVEKNGVVLDYGDFRVTVARAGGANKAYGRALDAKTRPYRRAIQTGTMSNERSAELLREVYAETVIRNWEIKDEEGEWVQGIEGPEGEPLPFNKATVTKVLTDLPDLFQDIKEQSERTALFRDTVREEDAGNS